MYTFPMRRRRAEALGYVYEGHLRGLGIVFFCEPKWVKHTQFIIRLLMFGTGASRFVGRSATVNKMCAGLERSPT
jgi:hypothetical protein